VFVDIATGNVAHIASRAACLRGEQGLNPAGSSP
jgi:hypothetical protein